MSKVEWESFKKFMHSKRQKHRDIYTISLSKAKTEEQREILSKAKDRFGPHELWKFAKSEISCKDMFPHCAKLLYFLLIFPLSKACVERFFSKTKLVNTRSHNQLEQTSLEIYFIFPQKVRKKVLMKLFSNI